MALSTNLKLGLGLPLLLVAVFGGAHALFYESWRTVTFIDVEPDRTTLIASFVSYTSTTEFESELVEMGAPPHAFKDDQEAPPAPNRPPFKHTFIDVEGFTDLGHTGTLTAHFFNDRLAEVWFQTPDIQDYYAQLLQHRGIPVGEPGEMVQGNLRVRMTMGPENKTYVFVEDGRLTDEMKLWIKRYS